MFSKKTIIVLIVLAVGLLAYLFFSKDTQEFIAGGGSGFGGSGGSSSSVKYINTQGKDGKNTNTTTLSEKIKEKNTGSNSTQNVTNINNNSTSGSQKRGAAGNSSTSYTYTLEGDRIENNSYSKNTKFNIDSTEKEIKDPKANGGAGGGMGQGGMGQSGRGVASRQLTDDELEKTDTFKQCMAVVEPLLSGTYTAAQVQVALLRITGFNLLTIVQQNAFASDIATKKYGNDARKYCLEITKAITDVFGSLAIYKECIGIVAPLLQTANPQKTDIKVALLKLTGFSLLKQADQDRFIDQIFRKEFGSDPTIYCMNIVRAIVEAIQGLALYKACIRIVEPLLSGSPSATEVRVALLKLPGFTLIETATQQQFINDIVTKKYGTNAHRYCIDIVSAILEALDPAKLYANCLIALKEVVKEKELLNGAVVPEETILLKLSVMGIFNGLNTFEERKQVAKQFFGQQYDTIIADIQKLTTQNYNTESKKICVKIVDLITGSIIDENIFAECVQLLNSAKTSNPPKLLLSAILPDFEKLTDANKTTLQNMFDSFLQSGTPSVEEICSVYSQSLLNNGQGTALDGTSTDSSSLSGSEATSGDTISPDMASETANACITLVRNIRQEYEQYSINSFADPVSTLTAKVPAYEFFIPGEIYSNVIDKTLIAYLSLPRNSSDDTKIHRDDNTKMMSQRNMSYFTNLSTHEKNQIAKRLFEVYRVVNSSPIYSAVITEDTIKTEISPYICKCSHPDCDDIKWNSSLSMYLEYKQNANASYEVPSGIFDRAQFLNSNPFYNKCLSNAALTLTSDDNTITKIRAKVEANLPEIKSNMPAGGGSFKSTTPVGQMSALELSDVEFSAFQCYVERCTNGGQCSIVCQNEIKNFCTNVATKYISKVPNVAQSTSPDQIFNCPKNSSSEFGMVTLHCLEISEKYNENALFRQQLQLSCVNSVKRVLTKNQAFPSGITQNLIRNEMASLSCVSPENQNISCPENESFLSLSQAQQSEVVASLYGKIINGNLKYEQIVEQSCYEADQATTQNQTTHFDHGMQYFIKDANSVKSNIVTRLWADNVSKMASSNRPVTQQECLQTAKEEWEKFMRNPILLEAKQSKLTLPPSKRCKCYLDSIYSTLHERVTKDDQECALIAADINAIANTIVIQSQNTANTAPSIVGKSLTTIPRFKSIPSADQSTLRLAIENEITANRQSARSDLLDRQIFLTPAQKTSHCNAISNILSFTNPELTACHAVLTKINYEMVTQKTVKSNNVLCTIVANTIKDFATDTGQVNVFSTADSQYNDIRQSTCTQKLRAIYLQIYGLKKTFWEGGENWTFPRTLAEESRPQCATVPDEYGNINYDAFVEE